jgi:hypothetical protein
MKKQGQVVSPAMMTLKALIGGGIGGAAGYYGTPRLFGYEDTPSARRAAAVINAVIGATVGAAGPKLVGKMMTEPIEEAMQAGKMTARQFRRAGMLPLAMVAGETIPIAQAALTQSRRAAEANADAARTSSIPTAVKDLLGSGTVRGAGVGAAGAGLAAIVSGLARRRSERELINQTSRGGMVSKDFLRYLLPALAAGGVMGSLMPKSNA